MINIGDIGTEHYIPFNRRRRKVPLNGYMIHIKQIQHYIIQILII